MAKDRRRHTSSFDIPCSIFDIRSSRLPALRHAHPTLRVVRACHWTGRTVSALTDRYGPSTQPTPNCRANRRSTAVWWPEKTIT